MIQKKNISSYPTLTNSFRPDTGFLSGAIKKMYSDYCSSIYWAGMKLGLVPIDDNGCRLDTSFPLRKNFSLEIREHPKREVKWRNELDKWEFPEMEEPEQEFPQRIAESFLPFFGYYLSELNSNVEYMQKSSISNPTAKDCLALLLLLSQKGNKVLKRTSTKIGRSFDRISDPNSFLDCFEEYAAYYCNTANIVRLEEYEIKLGLETTIETDVFWHNEDFTEVRVKSTTYQFNKNQGRCVQYLYINSSSPQSSIAAYIDSNANSYRLRDTFKTSEKRYHPAWGKLIVTVSGFKGHYRLNLEK